MFTGIVEEIGEVVDLLEEGTNRTFSIQARMAPELKVDQSVAHEGVCLTVIAVHGDRYEVTAVKETLDRTNLGTWKPGSEVNIERCLRIGDRLDGHMVQGHVDATVRCTDVRDMDGSWAFTFALPEHRHLLVQKGSVCINGVSLTVAALDEHAFSVAIIPYTFAHTTFGSLRVGDSVNIEFDVLGKYVERMLALSR
ncbi:MAG: riboflavin synthase [Flavobacteriales bacterium]|nr:riboflavin synthase [Flavobacteriales bacterium]